MKEPNIFQRAVAKVIGLSAVIWAYIARDIIPILKTRAGAIIMATSGIAIEFILEAATKRDWTGAQKKEWVRDQVKQQLVIEGILTTQDIAKELFPNSVFDDGIQRVVTRLQVEGVIK